MYIAKIINNMHPSNLVIEPSTPKIKSAIIDNNNIIDFDANVFLSLPQIIEIEIRSK